MATPQRHSVEELRSLNEDELAARVIDYTEQAGPKAQAEMMRRLILALHDLKRSTDQWARINAGVGLAIVALTIVLIVRA